MVKRKKNKNPFISVSATKRPEHNYILGQQTEKIKHKSNKKIVFSFAFLSFRAETYCFNNEKLDAKTYRKLLQALLRFSNITYQELYEKSKYYHFHDVDIKDKNVNLSELDIKKCFKADIDISPMYLYQIKVFEEARMIGFIYEDIFYILLFDRQHNVYKRK